MPADLTNAVAITAGSAFELALRGDGRVTAWGDNTSGEIDSAAALARVVSIGAGSTHAVALLGDGSPQMTVQPRSQSSWAGGGVTFAAKAVGDAPLSFQWFKDGMRLGDTTNVVGTATPTLNLINISFNEVGGYSVFGPAAPVSADM